MTECASHSPCDTPTPKVIVGSRYVCRSLGIDRSTLTRRIERGEAPQPVGKLPGPTGAFIFDRREVDALAAKAGERQ